MAVASPTTIATQPTTAAIAQGAKYAMDKLAHAAFLLQPATSTSSAHATGSVTLTTNVLIQTT
jgi:hypothetical protein